ncbi:hypothetical protein RYH73_15340 [Olivibacter sp. CPCC 100613]|uniref:hypothetical protein n=1 Tax=Olivibacter sp. CPCC 100613 TaxID=3079931 RepID=UPI002FF490C9
MFKNYFKKALAVPMLLLSLSFTACNKDNAVQQETKEKAQIETLKEFLAEKMHLEPSSIGFDQETRKFLLPAESGDYTFEFDYESVLDVYTRDKNQPK